MDPTNRKIETSGINPLEASGEAKSKEASAASPIAKIGKAKLPSAENSVQSKGLKDRLFSTLDKDLKINSDKNDKVNRDLGEGAGTKKMGMRVHLGSGVKGKKATAAAAKAIPTDSPEDHSDSTTEIDSAAVQSMPRPKKPLEQLRDDVNALSNSGRDAEKAKIEAELKKLYDNM